MRAPSPMDLTVRELVQQELAAHGGVADVRHVWGDSPGMWFVEVLPADQRAAPLTLALDGRDLLIVTVGRTRFEIFPFGGDSLDHVRRIVRAVFAGRVEEARTWGEPFARLDTEAGTVAVGHVHVPWPWAWRPVRRLAPYGERVAHG